MQVSEICHVYVHMHIKSYSLIPECFKHISFQENLGKILRTSWIDKYLARRFAGCNNEVKDAIFLLWLDPEMCPRSKEVIPGLLRHIEEVEMELDLLLELKRELGEKVNKMPKAENEQIREFEDSKVGHMATFEEKVVQLSLMNKKLKEENEKWRYWGRWVVVLLVLWFLKSWYMKDGGGFDDKEMFKLNGGNVL
ncbi:hypothetical protein M9H77_23481 [Catharanthus roseus]|uniref:Uncharacterized protein n=1 Tax=Catharanthus roseus TaxID=4058 RepID=A0ACC0AWB6_CATRO|nr:hypothetical protein M9H77_23481 [Catharanthus roseus]